MGQPLPSQRTLTMSWRLILAIVLLALGASVWGGIQMGNWLVENGPLRAPNMVAIEEAALLMPTLDADGKPYVTPAPQPLINGRLGVPDELEPFDWKITAKTADKYNPPIALASTRLSASALSDLRQQGSTSPSGLQGIARIGPSGSRGAQAIQPVDITIPPPPPATPVPNVGSNSSWIPQFQREMAACTQRGFFERPSCSWDVRNKYCGPNNAWGQVDGCPAK